MHHHVYPITPSQRSANGALDIYVEGHRGGHSAQMLVGLSVLASATEPQVRQAVLFVEAQRGIPAGAIETMLRESVASKRPPAAASPE